MHDREVELGEPKRGQAVGGLEVVDGELEGRVVCRSAATVAATNVFAAVLEGGHAQAAGDDAGEPGQVRLRDLELREHRLRVGDERARGVGQPDAAAVALEQRDPDLRSSVASCCEIAGGVKERASAVAAIVPRAASS